MGGGEWGGRGLGEEKISFSLVQSLDWLGRRRTRRRIQQRSSSGLFCAEEALVSSSGMGRDVHSLTLSSQHFLWRGCRDAFPSLGNCQKKEVDLVRHPVVGFPGNNSVHKPQLLKRKESRGEIEPPIVCTPAARRTAGPKRLTDGEMVSERVHTSVDEMPP